MKKIVVLDAHITDCDGRYDWRGLRDVAARYNYELIIHNQTSPDQVVSQARGADILVVSGFTPLTEPTLTELSPKLRYVMTASTGHDRIDTHAAKQLGMTLANIPDYGTNAVADQTMYMLMGCLRQGSDELNQALVASDQWKLAQQITQTRPPRELGGKVLGIIGLGRIGTAVAKRAQAFGMDILVHTRTPKDIVGLNVRYSDLPTLLQSADVVSLHCELNQQTRHIMNEATLGMMKPTAYLLNTSRGGLIDEKALLGAILDEKIAGASLDVMEDEANVRRGPLARQKNVAITSHTASMTDDARQRLFDTVPSNVESFLQNKPQNLIVLPIIENGHAKTHLAQPQTPKISNQNLYGANTFPLASGM
jgi:glycerate dehydrogenase